MKCRISNKYKCRGMCTMGKHKDDTEGFMRKAAFKIVVTGWICFT